MKITRIFTYEEGPWYTPAEAMQRLGHRDRMLEQMVLKISEYKKRRLFALPQARETPLGDEEFLGTLSQGFSTMAGALAEQYRAWEGSRRKSIKSVTVINNQGIPKPAYPDVLKQLLGVNGIPVYHVAGMNCGSTFLALQHLYRLRKKRPLGREECDLVFSIEVPSSTLRCKRAVIQFPFFAYDMVISDGGALAVVESADDGPGLEIIGHRNFFYPKAQGNMLSRAVGCQVEHGVAPEIMEDLAQVTRPAIDSCLSDLGLAPERIAHWILHPGGVNVINAVLQAMGFEESVMKHSFDTIRSQGNSMSSLILYVLRRYFESKTLKDGDLALLIGIAPGFEIQTITARYC